MHCLAHSTDGLRNVWPTPGKGYFGCFLSLGMDSDHDPAGPEALNEVRCFPDVVWNGLLGIQDHTERFRHWKIARAHHRVAISSQRTVGTVRRRVVGGGAEFKPIRVNLHRTAASPIKRADVPL